MVAHRTVRWSLCILVALLLSPLAAQAGSPRAAPAQIDSRLRAQLGAEGQATFWVLLRDRADLGPARAAPDWASRGRAVVDALQATADRSQAGLRGLLRQRGAPHQSFWIVNAIKVSGGRGLLEELAARPEVAQIIADRVYQIPKPQAGAQQAAIQAIEWGIDRIRADEVWATFGVRGENIVIANIDTGVQFDHPALAARYRGNNGGSINHNYNWFDPSNICGSPSLIPCDNSGHGTHTMGTMVGDDGAGNQIGVAPRARWIAAKGCEDFSCSFSALLASGQWVLAPTDLNGQNPRPDLRPHIVNNSWGGGPGDTFYQATVQAWVAAGIFPAFANGNSGPGCNSVGSPGDYPESYGVGAFDITNAIAGFSGRGPSAIDGGAKPNISAPGVDVRSSVPGNGYDIFSGTSMATPHVAGAVALIWSAAPAILGDIAATRALLDQTAIDTADPSCGGTDGNNNVWGEGRLDAFAAVDLAPRGPTGTLRGRVTDAITGAPIAGATVQAAGPSNRTALTNGSGVYSMVLPVGTYDVTARMFGYLPRTARGVAISRDTITTRGFALSPAPAYQVSGYVRDTQGRALANATVTILGTPIAPATSDAQGFYSFASVPVGTYDARAEVAGCNDPQNQQLVVDGPETLNFALPQRTDGYGYVCEFAPFAYVAADTVLQLSGDDSAVAVNLPFPFIFYGRTHTTAYVSTNGFLNFRELNANYGNDQIPNPASPNAAIYPFWDDMFVDDAASVRTRLLGTAPNRRFVIEWRNVPFCCPAEERVDFEVILYENGRILTQYRNLAPIGRELGDSATVGIENADGTVGLQYSLNQPALRNNLAVLYRVPNAGFVAGRVTDAIDGLAVAGATVRGVEAGRSTVTDADGRYLLHLPQGANTIEVTAQHYGRQRAAITVPLEQTIIRNFTLRSARAQVEPAAFEFIARPGRTRTQTLTIRNTGMLNLTFEIGELLVVGTNRGVPPPSGATSRSAPSGYVPRTVPRILGGNPVLVFMDVFPWDSNALPQVLSDNSIPHDVVTSAEMATINLSPYQAVFISSDQPQIFYERYQASLARFNDYVQQGGFLWFGAAAWGWNGGDADGVALPGGARVQGPVFEGENDVIAPAHPTMQGIPDPFSGTGASHAAFENLPPGTTVIARGMQSNEPTLIEYDHGNGRVLAFGQVLEYGWRNDEATGRILENGVPYAYAFEPVIDIPWLAVQPSQGTIAPGAAQAVQVTINTTGLAPGFYRARLSIRVNDPRNPIRQVPVTLIVPAYQQAANAGGPAYTDRAGDGWAADQAYTTGRWGYVNRSTTPATQQSIAGTTDDPLYQDARQGGIEYRFDRLPAGMYQVELRFAEIHNYQPNHRLFDVTIEGGLALFAHDIAMEVGGFVADNHTFFVPVTDGQLNVRFVPRRGYGQPIISALRVTHRPDR